MGSTTSKVPEVFKDFEPHEIRMLTQPLWFFQISEDSYRGPMAILQGDRIVFDRDHMVGLTAMSQKMIQKVYSATAAAAAAAVADGVK
jgi:hypothetical protein